MKIKTLVIRSLISVICSIIVIAKLFSETKRAKAVKESAKQSQNWIDDMLADMVNKGEL